MDAEKFLFSLSRYGIRLGLGPTERFANSLGNPHTQYKTIHIGGSNGKGSTSTFIYRILRKKYRAGLYSSPHLRRFSERIVVDDSEISSSYIEKFVEQHDSKIPYNDILTQLTFFEYTTVMAFKYFQDMGTEFLSVEVGLGGRLDSTNIIYPEASVISSISLEHSDKLGGSIEDIAREKGGIIKNGKPVIIGKMPETAKKVIYGIAREKKSEVRETEDCKISNLEYSLRGTSFNLETESDRYDIKLQALGEHQVGNSVAAILAYESSKLEINKEAVQNALNKGEIPGRFEIRNRKPLIVVDGAHNSEASRILTSNIRRYKIKNPLVIVGLLKDKNSYNILQNLSEVTDSVVTTEPNEKERKKDSEELKREASLFFKEVKARKRPKDALELAIKSGRNIVVTGSLYLVGEMELLLDEKLKTEGVRVEMRNSVQDEELIE